MNAHGRMIRVDSKTAPPPTPAQRAGLDIIGALAQCNLNLSDRNYRLSMREAVYLAQIAELEAALDAVLTACDSAGLGFSEAIIRARVVRRR